MNRPKLPSGIKYFISDKGEYTPTGAMMGRTNDVPENRFHPCKLYLRNILTGDDGAYDEEGAYWGTGKPVFWAHRDELPRKRVTSFRGHKMTYNRSESEYAEINVFLRARNRTEAKAEIRKLLPNATFYS